VFFIFLTPFSNNKYYFSIDALLQEILYFIYNGTNSNRDDGFWRRMNMGNQQIQHFNRPIGDVIRERSSVRTYKAAALTTEDKERLQAYAAEVKGPFGAPLRLELLENREIEKASGGKLGTYGVIKGASTYIAAVTEHQDKALEELGYCLEKVVLYGASIGIGTCWLGGTFKKSQFARQVRLREQEFLPIVTPVGYPAEKRGMVESLMRRVAGSDHRKPWEELFFMEDFSHPLGKEAAGEAAEALEMIRLAPSASNKQPWRIVKQGGIYHFCLQHTKGYGSSMGFDMQKIDMGIAMCHFEMTLAEAGIKGSWTTAAQIPLVKEGTEYIISWTTL
jgi:hypothetical protein